MGPLTPCNTMNSLIEGDMDVSNTTSNVQVVGVTGEENKDYGDLPPPTPRPPQTQIYMKGKYKSEDGYHKCKGFWAQQLEHHDIEQEEALQKGLISKFQFELDSSVDSPCNGRYEGYWML